MPTPRFQRKSPHRTPKETVLVVCEGKTEVWYLKSFCGESVYVRLISRKVDPDKLLDVAIIEKQQGSYDSVWCVFDLADGVYSNGQLQKIHSKARANNIDLAISNPNIELWFLLHFQSVTSTLTGKDCIKKLEGHTRIKYNKKEDAIVKLTHSMAPNLDEALKNASALERLYDTSAPRLTDDPFTTITALIKKLNKGR